MLGLKEVELDSFEQYNLAQFMLELWRNKSSWLLSATEKTKLQTVKHLRIRLMYSNTSEETCQPNSQISPWLRNV
jgi:hypothetical protein